MLQLLFYLYLMFHTYAARFDVTENLKNFIKVFELALFSSHKKPKTFQDYPSHRILRHMYRALNVDEDKN